MNTHSHGGLNVLLCGASGFIGGEIRQALARAGHRVLATRSHPTSPGEGPVVDFTRAIRPAQWEAALAGVDAVINAVGLLRDTPQRPLILVHEAAPMALFDACAQADVRRVLQVSALGIADNPTLYARTKQAADDHLLALTSAGRLDGLVLRPSIVFGPGGASSRLFMNLARSPVLVLPDPVRRTRVQPLAVRDLAQAVARLACADPPVTGVLPCVGPRALPLGEFIASLRRQQGKPPAKVGALPDWLTRWSARVGDHVPVAPWSSETLALLSQDNVADPGPFAQALGHPALDADQLVEAAWR